MRMGRNIIRAQSFGILSDWMTGYGFAPIVLDAYKNFSNDVFHLATGKKSPSDVISDFGEAQVAVYRDFIRLQAARYQPRSDEFRNHSNVRRYTRDFKKDLGQPQVKMERPALSQHSPAARHLKDAWWYADADEYKRVMFSARDDYANKAEGVMQELDKYKNLPPKKIRAYALEKGQKFVKDQISRMNPLYGIAGDLKVEWEGKKYVLKPKSDKKNPNAKLFWDNLKDHEKRNVVNAVNEYRAIVKELKLSGLYR